MPSANLYFASQAAADRVEPRTVESLRCFLAQLLTCDDIELRPEEISVRVVVVSESSQMIADVEVEIHAHEFAARVERQDDLACEVARFLEDRNIAEHVVAWLILSELGHSI